MERREELTEAMNKRSFIIELLLKVCYYYSAATFIWFVYLYNIKELPVEYKNSIVLVYLFMLVPIVFILKLIRYRFDKTMSGLVLQIASGITCFFLIDIFCKYKELVIITGLIVILDSLSITFKRSDLDSHEQLRVYTLAVPVGEYILGAWKFDSFIKGLSLFLFTLMLVLQLIYKVFARKDDTFI